MFAEVGDLSRGLVGPRPLPAMERRHCSREFPMTMYCSYVCVGERGWSEVGRLRMFGSGSKRILCGPASDVHIDMISTQVPKYACMALG